MEKRGFGWLYLELERRKAEGNEWNGNAIHIHPTSTHLFGIKSFNGIIVMFEVLKKERANARNGSEATARE